MIIKHLIIIQLLTFSFLSLRGQELLKNQQADIIIDEYGRIYIRTSINNKEGGLLFDTSSKSSYLANSLINHVRKSNTGISNGKQNLFDITEVKKLFSSSTLKGHTNNCMGVIGNNIIEKYIWDFDFVNMSVTISDNILLVDNKSDYKKIKLSNTKKGIIQLPVKINEKESKLKFDSSLAFPLIINKDIYPPTKNYVTLLNTSAMSMDISEYPDEKIDFDFKNIEFGGYTFNSSVLGIKENNTNRIGISFWHEFNRVVLDGRNGYMYLLDKRRSHLASQYSATFINKKIRELLIEASLKEFNIAPVKPIAFDNFDFQRFNGAIKSEGFNIKIFGNYFYLAKDSLSRVIYCEDSVLINNKSIKYDGWFSVDSFDGYHSNIRNNENTKAKFHIDDFGLIYIDAIVNDINGCMLFDTGAEMSSLDTSLLNNKHNHSFLYESDVEDSNLNIMSFDKYFYKKIFIGSLPIHNCIFSIIPEQTEYLTQDTIIGTIGQNIIKRYNWDFDLENKIVTISKKNTLQPKKISNINTINMDYNGTFYCVTVDINNRFYTIGFDSGFDGTLQFKNKLPAKIKPPIKGEKIKHRSGSAFSHLLTTPKYIYSEVGYTNIKLGNHKFNNLHCNYHKGTNTYIGISYWHEYKRIILDCVNNVIHLVDKRSEKELPEFSASKQSTLLYYLDCTNRLDSTRKLTTNCPYDIGFPLNELSYSIDYTFPNDTIYGRFKVRVDNSSNLKIISKDSIKLSDGKLLNGRYKFDVSDATWNK